MTCPVALTMFSSMCRITIHNIKYTLTFHPIQMCKTKEHELKIRKKTTSILTFYIRPFPEHINANAANYRHFS